MKEAVAKVRKNLSIFSRAKKTYRKLQKHLDRMPVGFPRTLSGIELRILQYMFSLPEAEVALYLDHKFRNLDEIHARAQAAGLTREALEELLEEMERKGSIFSKYGDEEKTYSLHPLIVGILEMQHWHLTSGLFVDIRKYVVDGYISEFLNTSVPQMRVIPIERSITPENNIATYDEIRDIVDRVGDRIGIIDCLCRKGQDLLGEPCESTDRREVCMFFRDFYDKAEYRDWEYGRKISKKEALEILEQNEKDGLVLMPSGAQEPQFVCSCCSCCCGALDMLTTAARPADFVGSNYIASLNPETCKACKKCRKRCQMDAIVSDAEGKRALAINEKRCVGCGLCVPTCKSGSIVMKKKDIQFVPPQDHEAMMDEIMRGKKGTAGKLLATGKAIWGAKRQ